MKKECLILVNVVLCLLILLEMFAGYKLMQPRYIKVETDTSDGNVVLIGAMVNGKWIQSDGLLEDYNGWKKTNNGACIYTDNNGSIVLDKIDNYSKVNLVFFTGEKYGTVRIIDGDSSYLYDLSNYKESDYGTPFEIRDSSYQGKALDVFLLILSFCLTIIVLFIINKTNIQYICNRFFSVTDSGVGKIGNLLDIYIQENKSLLSFSVFYCLVFGLVANGFAYFRGLFSHDSLPLYLDTDEEKWTMQLGRFFQIPYNDIFRDSMYLPWIVGVLSIVWISLASFFIIKVFNIRKKIYQCLICGLLSTNITVACLNATYMRWTDIYMFAMLLSVLAVYITRKRERGFLFGSIFLALSLGLYQSFFSMTFALFIIASLIDVVKQKELKKILLMGIKEILCLGIGGVIYYILLKIITSVSGIGLASGYNGLMNLLNGSFLNNILGSILGTYKSFFTFFFVSNGFNTNILVYLNVLIFIISIVKVISGIVRNKRGSNIFLGLLLLFIMPFAVNFVYFLSSGVIHTLMIYSWIIFYIFPIVLFDIGEVYNGKIIHLFLYLVLLVVVWNGIVYSNGAYLKKEMEEKATLSVMTQVLSMINELDEYKVGETPIMFIGNLNDGPLNIDKNFFDRYSDNYSTGLTYNYSISHSNTMMKNYFEYQLGYPINIVDDVDGLISQSDIDNMECFPNKKSIKMVQDTVVVKLSE